MINFTKEHMAKLKELATRALFEQVTVKPALMGELEIYDLLHCTTIGTLKTLLNDTKKQIEKLSQVDPWISSNEEQGRLETCQFIADLLNHIIGYKRYQLELESQKSEKAKLEAQLADLLESQKTPEEKIAEIKAHLESLKTEEL